ncbi:NTP transferase domain-containing protein [bacterium]|nr:NTP transferase domain-containing protein [bacterium]
MRAIIPAAGIGTRLRPHTHTVPKALVQVAGKPILGHILDEVLRIGVTEVVLVTGYMGERIQEYVGVAYPELKASYVHQEERKGLGHAIYMTRDCTDDEPSLIILGDTIVTADFSSLLGGDRTLIGVKEVDDPSIFGVVEVDGETVTSLVEKPDAPPSNLAIVGLYYIANTPLLMQCLTEIVSGGLKTKGEYQLTDALKMMLERGEEMGTFMVEGWYDCGRRDTLLETNRFLLTLSGGNGAEREGSILIQPVYVDGSAVIEHSVIGPYVSVAAGAVLRESIVRDSIVNANALLEKSLLKESLIGEGAVVKGHCRRLNVGESSEIDIGS